MARDVMLYEFIDLNRDMIISGTRDRVRHRPWPSVAPGEMEDGVPLFLTQLSETLRLEATTAPFPPDAIGAAATRPGGELVRLGLLIETEDECGGIPENKGDLFQVFAKRRGSDQSGLGLGLSIARKAVLAHGGDIRVRNMPGRGCVFTIDVPLAAEEAVPHAVV